MLELRPSPTFSTERSPRGPPLPAPGSTRFNLPGKQPSLRYLEVPVCALSGACQVFWERSVNTQPLEWLVVCKPTPGPSRVTAQNHSHCARREQASVCEGGRAPLGGARARGPGPPSPGRPGVLGAGLPSPPQEPAPGHLCPLRRGGAGTQGLRAFPGGERPRLPLTRALLRPGRCGQTRVGGGGDRPPRGAAHCRGLRDCSLLAPLP